MRAIRTQFSRVSYRGKKRGQCWMNIPAAPLPTPTQARLGGHRAGPLVLQPPNRGSPWVICPVAPKKSSWGSICQEMLLNDLSPAFPGLARATATGTEGMAKLKSMGGPSRCSQVTSPTCHQLQLKHSQVVIQSFRGLSSISQFQAPVLVLCTCCQGCYEVPAQVSNSFNICNLGTSSAKIFHFSMHSTCVAK